MERAQTKIVDSASLEGHEFTHYINNLCSVYDSIYGLLVNQSRSELKIENYNKKHANKDSIEIAIFNNDRQQAMGNITALLGMKSKVFIRDDTSMWSNFSNLLILY